MITFRVWLCELTLSAGNYFVLMRRVYEPRWGDLRAHRIGMSTRIVYICVFAYLIPYFAGTDASEDMLLAGGFWLALVLAFEWIGSFLLRRPLREILAGWHVERGYMWPYVLAAYAFAPLVVGSLLRPAS